MRDLEQNNPNILIAPAGEWSSTMAYLLSHKGYNINLFFNEPGEADDFNQTHTNQRRLSDTVFGLNVQAISGNDLESRSKEADIIFIAPPSIHFRSLASRIIDTDALIVSGTKGIEEGTELFMTQVLEDLNPDLEKQLAVLSGPNFAKQLLLGEPAVSTIVAQDQEIQKFLQQVFFVSTPEHPSWFRPYTSSDLIGTQFAGVAKNALTIAAAVCQEYNYSDNTVSGLFSRSLEEMTRFGLALGGELKTFIGPAGSGDLYAGFTSMASRNAWAGQQLALGFSRDEILESGKTIEGFYNAKALSDLAKQRGIDAPIIEKVDQVVNGKLSVQDAINQLLGRPIRVG